MRILYSHRIQSRDGMSVHVEELVTALRRAGHEVLVIGPSFYQRASFGGESRAVALARRLLPAALQEVAELGYNIPAYLRLRRAADEFRPDLLYERYNLYFLAGTMLARRRGLLFYVEVNSPLAEERAQFGHLRLRRLADWSERVVWRSAHRVLTVTGVLKAMIEQKGISERRIGITPNGIDPEQFMDIEPRPDAPDTLVLGFVGFAREWHGLDAVIAAMAGSKIPLKLVLVGDGPALPKLEEQALRLGLSDRIVFTGVAERHAIPGYVAGFDIALQPRAVPYASPLKVFEYMAAGRAIVAPDQPNIREILVHEGTALLFDPDEPGAMWAAVMRLVCDPPLRRRLGSAARAEVVRRDFTWRGNAARLANWAELDGTPAGTPSRAFSASPHKFEAD